MFNSAKSRRRSARRPLKTESLEKRQLLTTVGYATTTVEPAVPDSPLAYVRMVEVVRTDSNSTDDSTAAIAKDRTAKADLGDFDRHITAPGPGGGPNLMDLSVPRM